MKVSAADKAVAIVGVGAIMPDAPNAPGFWQNIKDGRYSITDVPPDRWDPYFYYDPDPKAPDKSYTKIGGWVQEWEWDPLKWRLPIPPKVSMAMDLTQKWGVVTAREALNDYGYPKRPLNPERVAVILGNAMGGDTHLYSAARVFLPEIVDKLVRSSGYTSLPEEKRREIMKELQEGFYTRMPPVSEDTMPGELSNILAGRIAALYDFKGPNYTADAACASAMAAISAAIVGLTEHDYDAVLTGGIDANMSPSTFVKFCKLGALSATGSRPYAEGSDGFVMGEGGAIILLKRLVDAERDGDKIYAIIRGVGGSSDGKGKGITAPNPVGQALCVRRAWEKAGVVPEPGDLIEGHGTSTPVGDAGELESLTKFFNNYSLPVGSIALGSVKSNIGHLKGAAGAAGILKAAYALNEKVLPPSLNFKKPNPIIDFQKVPFRVNTELRPWDVPEGKARRAAISAFGFGGTNFHMVMEEYIPGRIAAESKTTVSFPNEVQGAETGTGLKTPLRGAAVLGADSEAELIERLKKLQKDAKAGKAPDPVPPYESDLRAGYRLAIDYGDAAELADKAGRALKAYEENQQGRWKALRAKGIYRGEGTAQKVAFLFTGQGSQYVNMLKTLRETEPIVTRVFEEADRTMKPLLGKPLTDCIYLDKSDEAALKEAEENLKQTAITQPAVLATENAIACMLGAYGITPDMVMGHSLGEYGALVAAGAMSFDEALKAVSARGKEMTRCALDDNGMMAAAFGPIDKIQEILETVDEYVVIANINSSKEAVIGGTTAGVKKAMEVISEAGYTVRALQVSHAFHTRIVAPAGESLAQILSRMDLRPPGIPIVTNVTGEFYPMGPGVVPKMIQLLGKQVSSPVQFIKGLNTLYDAGARIFVEIGPKRILYGFVEDVLGSREGVVSLFTNHPRIGEAASLNLALCGLYAAGLGLGIAKKEPIPVAPVESRPTAPVVQPTAPDVSAAISAPVTSKPAFETGRVQETSRRAVSGLGSDKYTELGRLFAEFMDRGLQIYSGGESARAAAAAPVDVCITGASLGLPGVEKVFDDSNIERILRGEGFIKQIPMELRQAMADKNITRIVKTAGGEGRFETINSTADVIKLAARAGDFDIKNEFGFPEDRIAALDRVTKLAIGAGIDALRDAGIPLVMRYKTTTKGTKLPDRWMLPDAIRDDTGILFTSAFPGCDSFAEIIEGYYQDQIRRQRLQELENIYAAVLKNRGDAAVAEELKQRIDSLRAEVEEKAYQFDRRFLFRVLSMGHSQFAEYIGARGPNTSTNGACSSGTQALGLAQDWIRTGRCNRVIIISADDITSNNLMGWFGSGFLASGSAATDEIVEEAATPFDRRRHGLIIGMGASAVVLESRESAKARGIRPICNVLGSVVANSAFHGTRLDVTHICHVMERLISEAEAQWGINRNQIADETVFVSHETYTPARGGSASAEVFALRHVFKEAADRILVANTKGATGHPMAVGIEDVVSVKILETGIVPPVANFKEVDPELGMLNLSRGGSHRVHYALRLGAGFGSQISMSLIRWEPTPDGKRQPPSALGYQYRIEDPEAWSGWLKHLTGYETPELEVVQRTLRAKDQGPTARIENGTTTFSALQVGNERAAVPAVASSAVPAVPVEPEPLRTAVPARNPVQEEVLKIIAEKTGYPPDMLDLDLDLEADLGIDTVKQAEMFAAIRESYNIPREDNLKLRDFPTLSHVMQFVYDRRPDLAPVVKAPESGQSSIPAFDASPAAATPAAAAVDGVQQEVLKIIAEKTGYPPDMLDLDLDLEADLGIDTVKQAEMFAAIRESYDIPREDNLKLRDFPTLAHVIQFVYDRKPDLAPAPGDKAPESGQSSIPAFDASPAAASEATAKPVTGSLDAANAIPRRVPFPELRPALDFCKPTGAELKKGTRVVLMPDQGGIGKSLAAKLKKMGVEPLIIEESPDAESLLNRIEGWKSEGAIQGVFWLPALDIQGDIAGMDRDQWREACRIRVKLLYTTMRALYDQVGLVGTFLVSGTRLGGQHGYDESGAVDALGGMVTGFTKAFKRERSEATVKVVDFEPSRKTSALADILIDETLRDPGAVEIGYKDGMRWTVGLKEQPADGTGSGLVLNKETVFLVTGAAGSIVSAITQDLAAASGGIFYLLDLTPEPDPDNQDLARLETDKESLKRDLFERLKADGKRVTPVMVDKKIASLERSKAALDAIQAVTGAGGVVHYYSLDLTDTEAVASVIKDVADRYGRIDVLMHAAGLEISHGLSDKKPSEFDLVFDVKSDGWYNLISGIGNMSLGAAVVFSSVAGRFGNSGQTDYSSANDLLCKCISNFRNTKSRAKGIAIDWTAWGGIGMAARGSIPTIMKQAGIEMLPPEAGIPIVRRELTNGTSGEVVIGKKLGILMEEFDPQGGLETGKGEALDAFLINRGIMTGEITSMGLYGGLKVETKLDPTVQPFLFDHQINGTPVLPGVMGVEAMAEAAKLLFPERFVGAVENVEFFSPFKFYRNQPRTVVVRVDFNTENGDIVANCRLIGSRTLHGQTEPEVTTHFTGRVRLVSKKPKPVKGEPVPETAGGAKVEASHVYSLFFHGPAYQVLDSAWQSGDEVVGLFAKTLPPNHEPAELPTIVSPRSVELCFQTVSLSSLALQERLGLPYSFREISFASSPGKDAGKIFYSVISSNPDGSYEAKLVDDKGNVYLKLHEYRIMELPDPVQPDLLKPLKEAFKA